jgi:hypothetical protein
MQGLLPRSLILVGGLVCGHFLLMYVIYNDIYNTLEKFMIGYLSKNCRIDTQISLYEENNYKNREYILEQ